MVPLRGVFEQMGFTVNWDAGTSTATMQREGTTISITIGNSFITVNNQQIHPDVPPQLINGRFMLPLRTISEATGDTIDWDGATSTARITTAFAPVAPAPQAHDARAEITSWITATASIINFENNRNPRLFDLPPGNCPCESGGSMADCASRILRSGWGVNNANDLRRQVQSLLINGHNSAFWDAWEDFDESIKLLGLDEFLRRFVAREGAAAAALGVDDPTEFPLHTLELAEKWGDRGIVAWDLFRIGTLVSWGHAAGYIDREEALTLMEPAVNLLKFYFSSWEEAAENYLDGHQWWSRGSDPLTADSRWHNFNNAIPERIPGIYNDSLFNNPPTENFERTTFPPSLQSLTLNRGTWRPGSRTQISSDDALVGRWVFVSGNNPINYFEWHVDIEFFADGRVLEHSRNEPGTYTVLENNRIAVQGEWSGTFEFTYEVDGNTLTITDRDGDTGTWQRG
jgi:hypothetical protein